MVKLLDHCDIHFNSCAWLKKAAVSNYICRRRRCTTKIDYRDMQRRPGRSGAWQAHVHGELAVQQGTGLPHASPPG